MLFNTVYATVVTSMRNVLHLIEGKYYALTANWKRPFPHDEESFNRMRRVLQEHFGLEDASDVWITVYGQLLSAPILTKRFTYENLATAGLRLRLNKFINDKKGIEIEKLHAKLQEAVEKLNVEPAVQTGTHDLQGDLQGLQEPSEGVVLHANPDGVY